MTDSYRQYVPTYYDLLAQYYSDVDGPYLLGDKITYADFAVYQSIDNDTRTGTIPVSKIQPSRMDFILIMAPGHHPSSTL